MPRRGRSAGARGADAAVAPADVSYARAADTLRARRIRSNPHADGALDATALAGADVVVLAHPSEPKWEATTGSGSPVLTGVELDALEGFVTAGGGLVVLGESEQDKYGNNLNLLLARFGIAIEHDTVQDYERNLNATPSWVRAHWARRARRRRRPLGGRRRRLFLPRRHADGRGRRRCAGARTHGAERLDAGRTAGRRRPPRRGPRRRARRLRPLRRRLPRRPRPRGTVDQHRRLGRRRRLCVRPPAAPPRRPPTPRGSRCATPPTPCACCRIPTARSTSPSTTRPPSARTWRPWPTPSRPWRRASSTRRATSPRPSPICAPGRPRGPSPTSPRRWSAFAPSAIAADGIEHLVLFPMYTQNGSRDHPLRGAAGRRAVAGLARRAGARPL